MDPHARWLRRRIQRALLAASIVLFASSLAAVLTALRLATDASPLVVVPWAVLAAQAVVVVSLLRAAFTNPLGVRYLRERLGRPRRLALAAGSDDGRYPPELVPGQALEALATVWDITAGPQPVTDVFHTPQASVIVARSRGGGALTLLSRLDDGRILVTDTVMPPPHRRLVVNQAGAGDLPGLLASHLDAVAVLGRSGRRVERADASLVIELHAVEQVALQALGPVLGAFFDPTGRSAPTRYLVGMQPGELLSLALDPEATPVRASGPSPDRGSVGLRI